MDLRLFYGVSGVGVQSMMEYNGFKIYWDGHGAVRVSDEDFTVAVDPISHVSPDFEANLVLVTCGEPENYDREKIEEITDEFSCVVLPESFEGEEPDVQDVEYISEGDLLDIFGVEIEGVTSSNGSGYRFVMRDKAFYVSGDTSLNDSIRDMERKVDVAFLPIGGSSGDYKDAVQMAVRIKPGLAIPYLYGRPFREGEGEPREFKVETEDRNISTELLTPETSN